MSEQKKGFVLVLTLMMIAASVALISITVNRVQAYRVAHKLWLERIQARHLAQGGIAIAMGQLMVFNEKPKKEAEMRALADMLFVHLNAWQKFTLKESADGIEGEISLYVSCEQGKVNLAKLYDPEKKRVAISGVVDTKSFLEVLSVTLKKMVGSEIPPVEKILEALYKDRKQLEDVSDLVALDGYGSACGEVLYVTPERAQSLTDLFTVFTHTTALNPWVFSATARKMLGLSMSTQNIEPKKVVDLLYQPNIVWKDAWNAVLGPVYGKDFSALPTSVTSLFDTRFDATTFSVVSYGKTGKATQRLCAIIQKNQNQDSPQPYIIKKLYWL